MSYRICILGNSGSGKSTLAIALGQELNLPVFHLDRVSLSSNFQPLDEEKRSAIHQRLINQENWIIDGNYTRLLQERVNRSTLVVFIDLPRTTALTRVVNRQRQKIYPRQAIPEQAEMKLTAGFLFWVARYSRRQRLRQIREFLKQNPEAKLLVLKSGTVEDWVARIKKAL